MSTLRIIFLVMLLGLSRAYAEPVFDRHYSESFDDFSIELLLTGFGPSWGIDYLPQQRLLISEWKSGRLFIADISTSKVYLLTQLSDTYTAGQGGLLDVMAADDFSSSGRIYFSRAFMNNGKSSTQLLTAVISKVRKPATDNSFSFWRKDSSPYEISTAQLLFEAKPFVNSQKHFGGALALDENGQLFMSVGDRGLRNEAQNLRSDLGKIMRMQLKKTPTSVTVKSVEMHSLGHRNPQGLVFRKKDKTLWAAEHGPKGGDEINRIQQGHNYGWPLVTQGEEYSGGAIGTKHPLKGMTAPAVFYTPSLAVSALGVYQPSKGDKGAHFIKAFEEHFLLLSLKAKQVRLLRQEQGDLVGKGLLMEHIHERWRNITQSPDGEIFLLAESGKVYRIYQATIKPSAKAMNNGL